MKILLDPVYTQRPEVCSTSYLMWELIENLIQQRDDVFFYLLYPPDKMSEASEAFMNRHADRVTLLPLRQCTSDRLSEMYTLRNELRFYLNPWNTHCWDADVVVTSRLPVLKHMRVHSSRDMGKSMHSNRMFVGLDEMPILPFRDTVPWSTFMAPDTVMSYGLADHVLINNQWTKQLLRPYLREVLSAAWHKRVMEQVHEVVPVKLQRLHTDKHYEGGDFNVTFVGRITGTRNFMAVADLFRDSFSYPLGRNKSSLKFLISTNSESTGATDYGELDFVDLQMNDRPKFMQFLEKAHVAINLSTVEDFSLSTYETLLKGVPTVVGDYEWNSFLGLHYPFRVSDSTQAYAMINAFAANYGEMYAKFKHWEETWWKSYVEGSMNTTTGEKLSDLIKDWEEKIKAKYATGVGGSYKEVINSFKGKTEMNLTEYLKANSKMLSEVQPNFSLAVAKVANTLTLKLLAQQAGWKDTNQCGVMIR